MPRNGRHFDAAVCACLLLLVFPLLRAAQFERKAVPRPIVILGGTLIDGSGAPAEHNAAILVADGRIKEIGLEAIRHTPKDARRIDAANKWIIPGLIDGHVHFFQTGGLDARPDQVEIPGGAPYADVLEGIRRNPAPYLRAYVCAGVTSVVDFGGPSWVFDLRDSRRDDALSPRIAFTGPLLSTFVPSKLQVGGEPFWLMKDAPDIEASVRRLAQRKADLVKIWWVHVPKADLEDEGRRVAAAVDAAHRAGLRAAVHATALDTARKAVEAGADVLVHSVNDREVDDEFVAAVVRRKVLYIPTLMVRRNYRAVAMREISFEPLERECAPAATMRSFDGLKTLPEEAFLMPRPLPPDRTALQQRNLARLAAAGALIAAGTDAGNTRTLHGPSLHGELALMVEAGLSPMQTLVAATRNGALLMGRERELGQVKPGFLADLVVLDGDPLADIRNTRRISTVIRGGTIYER